MTAHITHEGILRRRLFRRDQLTRWDDLGGAILPAALSSAAQKALTAPALDGDLATVGKAFETWLAGPHGARHAARVLLEAATTQRASDVHVEPAGAASVVRFRVDGELFRFCALDAAAAARLCAAWKGMAGALPYRADVVQEGRIPRDGVGADVRASFVPTALGERVALRLFGRLRGLDELGLDPATLASMRAELARPTGLFVVAGATGSGKTTTIYAALREISQQRGGAHLSLEDPVEQRLRVAGISVDQVELCPERGITGETMLAAALRQDIDVLAVGEIRSSAEARLAVHAAHTGRLVLAGIHAGSAREATQRLLDLGVEPSLLRSTIGAVLHQSLEGAPRALQATLATARELFT